MLGETDATRYALNGGAHIAYQAHGDGPVLVLIADWFGHIDAMWEWPPYAHALRRLASFATLIVYDKRGVGLSDPLPTEDLPSMADWSTDIGAVLDDVGADTATMMGVGAGGPLCVAFAADEPSRVRRLVLVNSYARLTRAPDYPAGYPERIRRSVLSAQYTDDEPAYVLRGGADPVFIRWWRRFQRQSVSPRIAAAMRTMMFDVDVRNLLDRVRAPTLVIHRTGDEWVRVDHGRYLAEAIAGSTLIELDGAEDLFFQGNTDLLLDHVEAFHRDGSAAAARDRALATIVFTDIVGSTPAAARLGDQRWRIVLDDHDSVVHRHVRSWNGHLVKLTGDGACCWFDSPSDALRFAASLRDELGSIELAIRVGVHTGEIELRSDDIGGVAVHIAARVMGLAGAGEVFVSRTVRDVVAGSTFGFEPRGSHRLRGVPDDWDVYALM